MFKFEKLKENIKNIISFLFNLLVIFANVAITVIFMFGAISSLILLYKLFPETALTIFKPLLTLSVMFLKIIKFLIYLILTFGFIYWVFLVHDLIKKTIKESKIKMEIKREKFLNELAKKLNKRSKK